MPRKRPARAQTEPPAPVPTQPPIERRLKQWQACELASKRAKRAYDTALKTLDGLDPINPEYDAAEEGLVATAAELMASRRSLRNCLAGVRSIEE